MRKSPRPHRTRRVKEILDHIDVIVTMRCAYRDDLDSKIRAVRKLAEDICNPAAAQERNNPYRNAAIWLLTRGVR